MAAFTYIVSITGDCSNVGTGAILFTPTGGTEPYTVEWQTPNLGTDQAVFSSYRNLLQPNTYVLRVNDSSLPTNEEFYVNIPISDGICCDILSVSNTTCSLNNGGVTGTTTSDYSSTNIFLFFSDDTYITSAVTNQAQFIFSNLTAGTYYALAQDLGGCTGRSECFIVEDSGPFNFGLYVVPNSSCGGTPIGKIFVTGQTGLSPYSYLWSNGQTGSTITGLTAGGYSVSVTDSSGCEVTQSGVITNVLQLGFGEFTVAQPTCFSSDGSITLTITGGTAPYYYSASTGDVLISYSNTFSLSGLSSGNYLFNVTDAAFCFINVGTSLITPGGIASVSVSASGSTCSSVDGQILISVVGGTTPYVYTLIKPNGDTTNISSSQTSKLFSNLSTGTYMVGVRDQTGCSYMGEETLVAENKFTISTSVVGTSCAQNNGTVTVTKTTGGTEPFDYSLDGLYNVIDTTLSAVTFTNVSPGQHTITVTDATGCTQTTQVYVNNSVQLNYTLYSTSCGTGTDGTITAFISSGTPPFTFNWSSNISGNPQQIQVTGLTEGTYSLTVTDANGCSLRRSTVIDCNTSYVSYQLYVMGAETFQIQTPAKYGLLQMLNEGFIDLTSGNTNCDLISATFSAKVSVQPLGTVVSQQFFVSNSLATAPSDNLWYNAISSLLRSISGVGNVTIDPLNNQITIETSRNNNSLNGQEIIIELVIVYDTMCLT